MPVSERIAAWLSPMLDSPAAYLHRMANDPMLLVSTLLTLGVILVNGWTDAPNAIATCVSTRAIGVRRAVGMAAVCNFLGVLVMTAVNHSVAATVYNMADFGDDAHAALSQLLYQATQVIEVAGQPIHAVHHHCIAFADEAQQRFELGALGVLARCLVGEHLAHLGLFQLAFRVLVKAADPDVADAVPLHDVSLVEGGLSALSVPLCLKAHFCQAEIYDLRGHVSTNAKDHSILTTRSGLA